jgi:hypothetical protein
MDAHRKRYGFVSHKSIAAGCGSSIYATPDGREVEVTCVDRDPNGWEGYKWDDVQPVGEVTRWLRDGAKSQFMEFVPRWR